MIRNRYWDSSAKISRSNENRHKIYGVDYMKEYENIDSFIIKYKGGVGYYEIGYFLMGHHWIHVMKNFIAFMKRNETKKKFVNKFGV